VEHFGTENRRFAGEEWAGKEVSISIKGPGTAYYHWRADGLPSTLRIDEYDRDLRVRRRYLSKNGAPLDLENLEQGELVVAEVTVEPLSEDLDNVAVVDLLPAGLEIENPRLQSREAVPWIGDKARKPSYMDIRDDRMIFYGDFKKNERAAFYYGLRAVTEGDFIVPPVRAEAMYAPMKASVASSGRITVRRPGEEGR
jgi:hypothetical protein